MGFFEALSECFATLFFSGADCLGAILAIYLLLETCY